MYGQIPYNNPYTNPQYAMANAQLNNRMQMAYGTSNTSNDFQVVNGLESAKMYVMPPNSRVILMDKDLPRIYLKETDAANQYSLTAYDLVEVKEEQSQINEYVTRQELHDEIENLKQVLNESFTQEYTAESPKQFNADSTSQF